MNTKPVILLTGASGFIGRHFIQEAREHFIIHAVTLHAKTQIFPDDHENLFWYRSDISDEGQVRDLVEEVLSRGRIDFVIHLAGFYDFNYDNNPQYHNTNVLGTKYLLEALKGRDIRRFIFASSLAACEFPEAGAALDESSPTDGKFAYAVSKHKAEELVRAYSEYFPCSILRFAAIFSDWCEYGPLYVFLKTWLSRSWKARILGGRGLSAITYLHIHDLIKLFFIVIGESDRLKHLDTYIVSPDRPTTHKQLFILATWFYYGRSRKPFFMPKRLAWAGVLFLDVAGRLIRFRPFERPWMMKYVDRQLTVDGSYTRQELDWQPTPRLSIERRLLFLIEQLKSYPYEWQAKNMRALKKQPYSPDTLIYEVLETQRDAIIDQIFAYFMHERNHSKFPNYQRIHPNILRRDVLAIYQFLSISVRTRDRMSMLSYVKEISKTRREAGFSAAEVSAALSAVSSIIYENLIVHPRIKQYRQDIYDVVAFTFQLLVDEVENTFEYIERSENTSFPLN